MLSPVTAVPAPALAALPRLELRIGPTQLLLSELLPLAATELGTRVAAELDHNGALELPDAPLCRCGRPLWRGPCGTCRVSAGRAEPVPADEVPAPAVPWATVLAEAALPPAERPLAALLLADVDEYGVLGEPVAAVATRMHIPVEAVRRVVAALRRTGRPGLCAASLAERLVLQAAAVDGGVPAPVRALLDAGLDALAAHGPDAAARRCGLAAGEVREALAWLGTHLEPVVGPPVPPPPPRTVDVVVRRPGGRLSVEVVAGPWSAVRVAPSYLAAADDPRVRADVTRAERFLDGLDRRERTLHRVCEAALGHQVRRLDEGPAALRPLTRRELATRLGLHESTVGRVVTAKTLALPGGETLPLAALFGAAPDVRSCLREIVQAGGPPRSDSDLVGALAARGHRVARRTVAKYRAELGLPGRRRPVRQGAPDAEP